MEPDLLRNLRKIVAKSGFQIALEHRLAATRVSLRQTRFQIHLYGISQQQPRGSRSPFNFIPQLCFVQMSCGSSISVCWETISPPPEKTAVDSSGRQQSITFIEPRAGIEHSHTLVENKSGLPPALLLLLHDRGLPSVTCREFVNAGSAGILCQEQSYIVHHDNCVCMKERA